MTTTVLRSRSSTLHPGLWVAHCHIAGHHESGMMFSFDVDPADVAETGA